MEDGRDFSVPEEHVRAAEEVRAHLVLVRGGAPFLSPADSRVLVAWLDEGVPVSAILCAVERAAAARRAKRSRLPLTLTRAKVHLKAVSSSTPTRSGGTATEHPFEGLSDALAARGAAPLGALLSALDATDTEALVRAAVALARDFLLDEWSALPMAARERRLDEARASLVALDLGFDDNDLDAAAEELARDDLRRTWPMLEAAQLWNLATAKGGP